VALASVRAPLDRTTNGARHRQAGDVIAWHRRGFRLKGRLPEKSPKTVNNVLTVLNVLLKKAVEWDVIDRMPCSIRLLPIPKPSAGFYDFGEYERLVETAKSTDPNAYLIVLLGGDAGLRCGE
jgi:hypothetical protein